MYFTSNGTLISYPDLKNLKLDDMLVRLSREHRFSGASDCTVLRHIIAMYTVACELGLSKRVKEVVLTHDIQEALVRDVPSSFKSFIGDAWHDAEDNIKHNVSKRFRWLEENDLSENDFTDFNNLDLMAGYVEAKVFFKYDDMAEFIKEAMVAKGTYIEEMRQPLVDALSEHISKERCVRAALVLANARRVYKDFFPESVWE